MIFFFTNCIVLNIKLHLHFHPLSALSIHHSFIPKVNLFVTHTFIFILRLGHFLINRPFTNKCTACFSIDFFLNVRLDNCFNLILWCISDQEHVMNASNILFVSTNHNCNLN